MAAAGATGRDIQAALTCARARRNAGSSAAGLVARLEGDRDGPGREILLQLDAGEEGLGAFVGFGVGVEVGIELANGRRFEDGDTCRPPGCSSVLMVVGIGPGGVVSEYMCHSGSTVASRRPRTVAPGAARRLIERHRPLDVIELLALRESAQTASRSRQ